MIFHPLSILLELKISHILGKKNQTIISQLIKCKSVESSILDSCNLITGTLENGDLSKSRNLRWLNIAF